MKRSYSTDLTDIEWECLEPHVPAPSKRGRPRSHAIRKILDAVFYVLKSGCPWRLLPREFPPLGDRLLLVQTMANGRHVGGVECGAARTLTDGQARPSVSAGVVDSQSAKTT